MDSSPPMAVPRPPSPLACKKARLSKSTCAEPCVTRQVSVALLALALVPCGPHLSTQTATDFGTIRDLMPPMMVHDRCTVIAPEFTTSLSMPMGHIMPAEALLQASLDELEAASHEVRMDIAKQSQSDRRTGVSYERHVRNYFFWWATFQQQETAKVPGRIAVPAEPITAAKAIMFLQYESTRPKRKRGSMDVQDGTTIGKSRIAQAISALESHRKNCEHLHKDVPDARISLRADQRICTIEDAVKHNEPLRIERAQALKAARTSSDTYSNIQLMNAATGFLNISSGVRKLVTHIRDRAMLTSSSTAFRGDNLRSLLWSDLSVCQIPMYDIQLGHKVPALVFMANNGKTNQNGWTDEFSAFHHCLVELCSIGSIALQLYSHFHIQNNTVPNFGVDITDRNFGEYGRRDWYWYHVFYASWPDAPMSYEAHRSRINALHLQHEISITKVTHAGQSFAAQNTRSHGVSASDTKALGGWSKSGSFRSCYDHELPVDALVGSAMFNARQLGTYFIPRDVLDPPLSLKTAIFPWLEDQEHVMRARAEAEALAKDITLVQFFRVLTWFRHVLLQDMAILYSWNPSTLVFQYPPFNTATFRAFTADAATHIRVAEEQSRLAFQHLPERFVTSVKGIVTGLELAQQRDHELNDARWNALSHDVSQLKTLLEEAVFAPVRRNCKHR
ncbi:hypothetical protein SCP_0306740 [Sparassis crispa]|uniref:Ndc10 domain-containing protein n=1 Tax=Sparassis crispa TaxID=139825 RepID=A0A401GFP7_9APHY|nr:hypothetical protein SCP_0306740 [Sparassis crispa]GBE80951.1 hypothetical protein SCP_0306740 [Sparassis crispa]